MKNISINKMLVVCLITLFIMSDCLIAFGSQTKESNGDISTTSAPETKYIELEYSFSYPEVVKCGNYWVVRVKETNHNRYVLFDLDPGKPVLPVNVSIFKLVFGSEIINVEYEHSTPQIINLSGKLAFCTAIYDNMESTEIPIDKSIYERSEPYPSDWVSYHTGGGLSDGEHKTFLVSRVYPVRYFPEENQLQFIQTITVNISYMEPSKPILQDNDAYDLLILAPSSFTSSLQPLVNHKTKLGVKTNLVSLEQVYHNIFSGRDEAEKIKLFIKQSIEESGIKYVLLVGGRKGQFFSWNLPVRYSKVIPTEEQEYPEPSFISDLYFADIYFGNGSFSSWDSNNDGEFSVWNDSVKDEMDLYPDVYLGRLPCRNTFEVRTIVNKIINYEKTSNKNKQWFKNLILVAGDSYNDIKHYNEGELISEKTVELMPGFNPVRLYAKVGQDINRKTVNNVMNKGAGFAYFCGHGNPALWSTHYPPNGTKWATGYGYTDMTFLINLGKLPITVVGGCHNGQFDVTILNLLVDYEYANYHSTGIFECWSEVLTRKFGGGSIATISNTGLGTHGDGDIDNNTICDYLEILDGWLELRFFELYGKENKDMLGENHGDAITGYLNTFLGDETKMDVKMVQQWALFGDPSLKIGGYT
jgi:hypothetical protein